MTKKSPTPKKPRYVYLVTSFLGNKPGCRSGPVLGVHTNYKKALRHYRDCMKAQLEYKGSELMYDHYKAAEITMGRGNEWWEARINHEDKAYSLIGLERWKV